jgi:hypothetical protein
MMKINEKEKTVENVEIWSVPCVKYVYESLGVYDIELTEDEFFQILKNAAETVRYRGETLTDYIIGEEIHDYIENTYPDYYETTIE